MNLIRDLDTDFSILGKDYINVIQVSSHLFAMTSTCYNPFIYASLHNKILSYLCQQLLSWRKEHGKDQNAGSSTLKMSKVTRLHTTTIVADLPGLGQSRITPEENYAWVFTPHDDDLCCLDADIFSEQWRMTFCLKWGIIVNSNLTKLKFTAEQLIANNKNITVLQL